MGKVGKDTLSRNNKYRHKEVFGMSNQRSRDLKPGRKERFAKLPTEIQTKIGEFEKLICFYQGIRTRIPRTYSFRYLEAFTRT